MIDHIECSFKANCNRVTLCGLIPKSRETSYSVRILVSDSVILRDRSSPPTTDCDKIRPLQTLEALLTLLSAKPNIFLLPDACLLNIFVCCTFVLTVTEVYPELTRHLGAGRTVLASAAGVSVINGEDGGEGLEKH